LKSDQANQNFASPIVLVKKKTGEIRLCIDHRKLNKALLKDNYPLPHIDDLLDKLVDKKVLDLKNGYFHVFVNEESVKYTSFVTPLGQFKFLRMPMGIKNAPAVFQRFVNKILDDMIRNNKVVLYMDDIMVASKDINEHLETLEEFFKRLTQNRLELRMDKCAFLKSNIKN